MKYVSQKRLADWREENNPKIDPVSKQRINSPVVDHDHVSGMIRGVLDSEINAWEGRCYNAYTKLSKSQKVLPFADMLENLAAYVRLTTEYLHPKGCVDNYKRFSNKGKATQIEMLDALRKQGKCKTEDVLACKNSQDRTSLFRNILMEERY